jgi:hypothetical protein
LAERRCPTLPLHFTPWIFWVFSTLLPQCGKKKQEFGLWDASAAHVGILNGFPVASFIILWYNTFVGHRCGMNGEKIR